MQLRFYSKENPDDEDIKLPVFVHQDYLPTPEELKCIVGKLEETGAIVKNITCDQAGGNRQGRMKWRNCRH